MDKQKLQLEWPEEKIKRIEALMRESGVSTKKEFFNNALTLLEWAIREKRAGMIIASVDEENKKYKELAMPILDLIGKK